MAIDQNEQGGINFTHRSESNAEKAAAKTEPSKVVPSPNDGVTKPSAPPDAQKVIDHGGRPVKPEPAIKPTPTSVSNTTTSTTTATTNVSKLKVEHKVPNPYTLIYSGGESATYALDTGKGCIIRITGEGASSFFAPGVSIKETNGVTKLVGTR